MRDLGRMGESAFSQWCASAGLTANNSNVDKTGWDFLVEFDFDIKENHEISTLHDAAFECKVQVKSTDKRDRKLPIKLSNLKRLATAPMPAFFVFIEFDSKEYAQRVFLLHVDKSMLSTILKRLHEEEQRGNSGQLHKKTMTIKYEQHHMLADVSGQCLDAAMRSHMGTSMSNYVAEKNAHLSSTGFDKGYGQLTFITEGEENIKKLIDMSLGLDNDVELASLVAYKQRFGKVSNIPFMDEKNVKLGMPDVKPISIGKINLKLDKLGSAFSFPAKMYFSPFNIFAPKNLQKGRISTEFFDLSFNIFTSSSTFSLSFPGKKFDIRLLRDSLIFIEAISIPGNIIYAEFISDKLPPLRFNICGKTMGIAFKSELAAAEAGIRILSILKISNPVEISLSQASHYALRLIEMDRVLSEEAKSFKLEIPHSEKKLTIEKDLACIAFFCTTLGNIYIGTFVAIIGKPLPTEVGYVVLPDHKIIERTVIREHDEKISSEDLISAAIEIEKKYSAKYSVFTLYKKSDF